MQEGTSTPETFVDKLDEEDRKSLKYKASVKMASSLWTNPNDFSSKIMITESGVYSLVFGSNLPSARLI